MPVDVTTAPPLRAIHPRMLFLSVVYSPHVTSRWFTRTYTLTIIALFSFYVHSFILWNRHVPIQSKSGHVLSLFFYKNHL